MLQMRQNCFLRSVHGSQCQRKSYRKSSGNQPTFLCSCRKKQADCIGLEKCKIKKGVKNKDLTDFHVHFGQYNNEYFYPQCVIDDLAKRKITEAWISSTTSCMYCREQHPELKNQPNAKQILDAVNEEFNIAINHAKLYEIKIHPLYWLVPEFEKSGVCFEKYSNGVKEIHRNAFF